MPREICWLPLPDGYLSRQEPTLLIMGQFLSASSQVIIEFWINTHAAIMGSKKPHDLLSATWRIRKAGSVIWSKSEGWRIWKADSWIPGLSSKAQASGATISESKRRWISQLKQREWIHSSTAFLFCSGPQWIRWLMSTCIGKGDLLYSLYWLKR